MKDQLQSQKLYVIFQLCGVGALDLHAVQGSTVVTNPHIKLSLFRLPCVFSPRWIWTTTPRLKTYGYIKEWNTQFQIRFYESHFIDGELRLKWLHLLQQMLLVLCLFSHVLTIAVYFHLPEPTFLCQRTLPKPTFATSTVGKSAEGSKCSSLAVLTQWLPGVGT